MEGKYLCAFLLCIGAALAQNDPKCCIPDKWESNFGFMEGIHPKHSRNTMQLGAFMRVSFDGQGQRSASSGTIYGRNQTSIRTIADYKGQKAYVIVNGRCMVKPIRTKFSKFCVPNAYSKYMGRSYFGIGRDTLAFDTWGISIRSRRMKGFATMGLISSCYPMSYGMSGSARKAEFMLSGGYTGMTAGIKDPSVFTPPSSCKKVEEDAEFEHDAAEIHLSILSTLTEAQEVTTGENDIY